MRTCTKCKIEKHETLFYSRGDGHGLRSNCKDCCAKHQASYKRPYTVKYRAGKRRYTIKRKSKNRAYLISLLGGECVTCRRAYPAEIMHFDYMDPKTQSFSISFCMNKSLKVLVEEAKKCILRCSNCHKMKAFKDRQALKATRTKATWVPTLGELPLASARKQDELLAERLGVSERTARKYRLKFQEGEKE